MNINHGPSVPAEPSTCTQLLLPLKIDPFTHSDFNSYCASESFAEI